MRGTMTGEQLRAERMHFGLSQDELAELTGISSIRISRWERGVHPIPRFFYLLLPLALGQHEYLRRLNR
jgi:transcriptional regulator with XRE-family HTH domain